MSNFKKAIAELIDLATQLDSAGEYKIASDTDSVIRKLAEEPELSPAQPTQYTTTIGKAPEGPITHLQDAQNKLEQMKAKFVELTQNGRGGSQEAKELGIQLGQQGRLVQYLEEKEKNPEVQPNSLVANNTKAQKLLNDIAKLMGKNPVSLVDGKVTQAETNLLKQYTGGYSTWGELFGKLNNYIKHLQDNGPIQGNSKTVSKDPNAPADINIEPLPAMPEGVPGAGKTMTPLTL